MSCRLVIVTFHRKIEKKQKKTCTQRNELFHVQTLTGTELYKFLKLYHTEIFASSVWCRTIVLCVSSTTSTVFICTVKYIMRRICYGLFVCLFVFYCSCCCCCFFLCKCMSLHHGTVARWGHVGAVTLLILLSFILLPLILKMKNKKYKILFICVFVSENMRFCAARINFTVIQDVYWKELISMRVFTFENEYVRVRMSKCTTHIPIWLYCF